MVEITPVLTSSDDEDVPEVPVVLPENLSTRFRRLLGRNINQNRVLPGPLPNPQFDTTTASLENVNMQCSNNPSPADGTNPDGSTMNPMFTPTSTAPTGIPAAPPIGTFRGFGTNT